MKYFLILSFFIFTTANAFDFIYNKLTIEDSKLCIKADGKIKKCSADSLTRAQQNSVNATLTNIKQNIPPFITNDILTSFLKFNPTFGSNTLLGTFERVKSTQCKSDVGIMKKRRPEIQKRIQQLQDEIRRLDSQIVTSCTGGEFGKIVYPPLPNLETDQ